MKGLKGSTRCSTCHTRGSSRPGVRCSERFTEKGNKKGKSGVKQQVGGGTCWELKYNTNNLVSKEAINLESKQSEGFGPWRFLQVGLEGVLLSSCSAAGMWRVRDLAGLGRDDFFSGLRYALSWINRHTAELRCWLRHAHAGHSHPSTLAFIPHPHFTFSTHFLDRGDGREHAEEGRASQSSACTRGLRLRLQAEPGRGGSRSNPRRCIAIFNTTALVGLLTVTMTTGRKGMQGRWKMFRMENRHDKQMEK